jgi:integrase/recombinase XerD
MNTLRQSVGEYLDVRRRLGAKLHENEAILSDYVAFAEQEQAELITTKMARHWACRPEDGSPARWARRLATLRLFAQYLSAQEPRTEIPPKGLLPHSYSRATPYIYTDEQVEKIIRAARDLPSTTGMTPASYATFFALLAVTGMRVGEAVHLERKDVDLDQALLTLHRTKLNKQRLVPIHPSTRDALLGYQSQRDQIYPSPSTPRFFLAERGGKLREGMVGDVFRKISRQIGLRDPSQSRGPRLHDLRHRFAVRTVIGWYRSGADVEAQLPKLATYLGHSHVRDTYWYLTAVPELMQWAVTRLDEEHHEHQIC